MTENMKTPPPHILLRRRILLALYEKFRERPAAPTMTAEALAAACGAEPKDFNWNVEYLYLAKYLDAHHLMTLSTYTVGVAWITKDGIDLVEDESEFNRRFPSVIEQHIAVHGPFTGNVQAQGSISGNVLGARVVLERIEEAILKDERIPEHEKSSLLSALRRLLDHPIVSGILTGLGLRLF